MTKHEVRESTGQVLYPREFWTENGDGEPFVTASAVVIIGGVAALILGAVVGAIWLFEAAVYAIGE